MREERKPVLVLCVSPAVKQSMDSNVKEIKKYYNDRFSRTDYIVLLHNKFGSRLVDTLAEADGIVNKKVMDAWKKFFEGAE